MSARELAYNVLLKDRCSPKALDAFKDTESSDAIWLFAAQLAQDWHGADWDWFVQPGNLLPVSAERYFTGDETHDTRVLRTWLKYAKERIKKTERRMIVAQLANGIGNPAARAMIREKASGQ